MVSSCLGCGCMIGGVDEVDEVDDIIIQEREEKEKEKGRVK